MGSAFVPGGIGGRGVIPKVMDTIFSKIEAARDTAVTVRVGFVEIHTVSLQENVRQSIPSLEQRWRHSGRLTGWRGEGLSRDQARLLDHSQMRQSQPL